MHCSSSSVITFMSRAWLWQASKRQQDVCGGVGTGPAAVASMSGGVAPLSPRRCAEAQQHRCIALEKQHAGGGVYAVGRGAREGRGGHERGGGCMRTGSQSKLMQLQAEEVHPTFLTPTSSRHVQHI